MSKVVFGAELHATCGAMVHIVGQKLVPKFLLDDLSACLAHHQFITTVMSSSSSRTLSV